MKIKGFIKSKEVFNVLMAGNKSGQNVVLYGRGGYGKSEMSLAFLRQLGASDKEIQVKSLSVGTTTDDLFGGINVRRLKETGEIHYNLNASIFSTPYLILEEAFDAPVRVLESLKDVLTSKKVRNGNQVWEIKTKFIIVCTNRAKSEVVTDESSAALLERFPLSLEVGWKTHTLRDYQELIECVKGESSETFNTLIQYMIESIKEDESQLPPSPRTVVRMYNVLKTAGIDALRFMDGLPNIQHAIKNIDTLNMLTMKAGQLRAAFRQLKEKGDEASLSEIKRHNKEVKDLINEVGSDLKNKFSLNLLIREI